MHFKRVIFLAALLFPMSIAHADDDVDLIPTVNLVPTQYRHRLVQQLSIAEDNQQNWLKAITAAKPEHREAMAYLLVNMPEADLKSLKGDYLLSNVDLAYQARESTAWGKAIPEEIFFREVLPYANLDETREDWRKSYFDQFMPLVKEAKSASEAAMILNKHVFPTIKVKYHATKRLKPNQSPAESTKIGYASCTGLSIILSDACRAVGVPARVAGTPLWFDKSGNHTWTEVWDRQWYFVGSAEPGPLNKTWFVDNAAKADPNQPEMRIYAASFDHTSTAFPMVWTEGKPTDDVHAEDVTGYYTGRVAIDIAADAQTRIELRQNGILVAAAVGPTHFDLPPGTYSEALIDYAGKVLESKTLKLVSSTTKPAAK
jgi:hypothetical protein